LRTFTAVGELAVDAAFSPDGKALAIALQDRTARIESLDALHSPRVLHGHTGAVNSVAWSPDGQRLATASSDGTLRVWTRQGDEWATIASGARVAWQAAWSRDGAWLWAAMGPDGLRRWPITDEGLQRLARGRSQPEDTAVSSSSSATCKGSTADERYFASHLATSAAEARCPRNPANGACS